MPKRKRQTSFKGPKGEPSAKKSAKDEEFCKYAIAKLPLSVTGAREGDILQGFKCTAKGAVVKLCRGFIPPRKSVLDTLRRYPSSWRLFLNKLNSIKFFAEMESGDKESWLEENQVDAEMDMADAEVDIEVLDVGESGFAELEEQVLSTLLAKGAQPAIEVRNAFPLKDGSSGLKGRSTLALLVKFWSITIDFEQESRSEELTLLLDGSTVPSLDRNVLIFRRADKDPIRIEAPAGEHGGENDPVMALKTIHGEKEVDGVIKMFKRFTPAAHKSLVQKIIRFRPCKVEGFPSSLVAQASFATLANMPGSFVPDIQRFVTGKESALKRLVITIIEDSFHENAQDLFSVLIWAFLAQRQRSFSPTYEQWCRCFVMIEAACEEDRYFVYDWGEGMKMDRHELGNDVWPNISSLADELRSFQTDLGMIRSIVDNGGAGQRKFSTRPENMSLIHCVDFHWAPEIVYYFDPSVIDVEEGSKPFHGFYRRIFREVTGFNPRKSGAFSEKEPFVQKVRSAQKLLLRARQRSKKKRTQTGTSYMLESTLDDSWLAGMVGTQEVGGRPAALVALNPYDFDVKTALRKPSRDMKQSELTAEQEEKALDAMDERLAKGISLKNPPLPHLEGAKWDGKEVILKRGKRVSWSTAQTASVEYPILEPVDDTLKNAIRYSGYGYVEEGISQVSAKFPIRIVQRAMGYLAGSPSYVEMPRISRDGGGSQQSVIFDDVATFQYLLRLSLAAPAMIRLVPFSSIRFEIPSPPLMWFIRDILLGHVADIERSTSEDLYRSGWPTLEDSLQRELWPHQKEGVEEMLARKEKGYKGNFLWYRVGMGKCLDPNTPVLMWSGDIKKAKDVVVGDQLIGDDGKPRNVLSTCQGRDEMFRVSQIKGDDYVVNKPHILTLMFSGHKGYYRKTARKNGGLRVIWFEDGRQREKTFTDDMAESKAKDFQTLRKGSKIYKVKPYEKEYWCITWFDKKEMRKKQKSFSEKETMMEFRETIDDDNVVDISVEDFLKLPRGTRSEFKGFKAKVDWPHRPVRLDPYILGVWLGDGSSHISRITNVDEELIRHLEDWCDQEGYGIKKIKDSDITYSITEGLHSTLRKMGLLKNKHIPVEYLVNDRETRLNVLAGIIDTDGYYTSNCYEIVQKRKVLAEGIKYLCGSLGFGTSYKMVEKTCTNAKCGSKTGTYYKVIIFGEGLEEIPCKISRKKAHKRNQTKNALCTGIRVESIGEGNYCGFTIDGNARFLLGDFTVTHNTMLVLEFLRRLPSLPPHIVYTLPSEAIKSVSQEIEAYGFRVQLWVPLKGRAKSYPVDEVVKKVEDVEPFTVTLIEHDHLRRAEEDLKRLVGRSIFIVDEVHKTFNDTKRTSMAKDLAKLAIDFIVLTGTPIIDNKMYKLIWWLQQIMPFEVKEKNFWVAISGMVSRKVNTGVIPLREEVEAPMDSEEAERYRELAPPHIGGSNAHASYGAIQKATKLCYQVMTRAIVDETVKEVEDGKGVMVVARSSSHQEEIRAALEERGVRKIYVLEKNKSIHLTDESKEDYDVVIVPLNKSTGYSLTKLKVMITGVYPSNHATRDQLEGRIIRIGQKEKFIRFRTVHCGILTYIMENHKDARNIASIMQTLVKEA